MTNCSDKLKMCLHFPFLQIRYSYRSAHRNFDVLPQSLIVFILKNKENLHRLCSNHHITVVAGGVLWKAVLKNFTNFTGKHLRRSLFTIKLQVSVKMNAKMILSNEAGFFEGSSSTEEELISRKTDPISI